MVWRGAGTAVRHPGRAGQGGVRRHHRVQGARVSFALHTLTCLIQSFSGLALPATVLLKRRDIRDKRLVDLGLFEHHAHCCDSRS